MLRKINSGWIQITARDTNIGATINLDHVAAIRLQPEMTEVAQRRHEVGVADAVAEPTGRYLIYVDLVTGQTHALTMDTWEEASEEYERLATDIRGETVQ